MFLTAVQLEMTTEMIDKLDTRIPRKTPFTPEFGEVYQHASEKGLLTPSKYYAKTGDFRPYGYQMRLHVFSNYGRRRNNKQAHDHKLELYDTAEMTFDDMLAEIKRVFICDPLDLVMLRRDICVDVVGIDVDWFKTHTRIELKRNIREIGYMNAWKKKGETFDLGGKPNQISFYDKVAERRHQYTWMLREGEKQGLAIRSFQETFGHSENAVITRIERRYGGAQCGGTLRSLLKIDRTNPFEPIKFLKSSGFTINPGEMDSTTYWAARHLQRQVEENSLQYVRAHISNIVGSKNTKRVWDKFSPYLCSGEDEGIDEDKLYELFLRGMTKQMGFSGTSNSKYPRFGVPQKISLCTEGVTGG